VTSANFSEKALPPSITESAEFRLMIFSASSFNHEDTKAQKAYHKVFLGYARRVSLCLRGDLKINRRQFSICLKKLAYEWFLDKQVS
jgi:hypothetical protein